MSDAELLTRAWTSDVSVSSATASYSLSIVTRYENNNNQYLKYSFEQVVLVYVRVWWSMCICMCNGWRVCVRYCEREKFAWRVCCLIGV